MLKHLASNGKADPDAHLKRSKAARDWAKVDRHKPELRLRRPEVLRCSVCREEADRDSNLVKRH